jgi:hypothetical protein
MQMTTNVQCCMRPKFEQMFDMRLGRSGEANVRRSLPVIATACRNNRGGCDRGSHDGGGHERSRLRVQV